MLNGHISMINMAQKRFLGRFPAPRRCMLVRVRLWERRSAHQHEATNWLLRLREPFIELSWGLEDLQGRT